MQFDTFVVYTTEEGGIMKVEWSSREEYEEAVRTGKWMIRPDWDGPAQYIDLKMVALASVEDLHDFILGGDRRKVEA